jgi:RNA polymerase sigma factor (TIGR02999 family)
MMSEVTRILSALENGNPQASQDLLPLVYDELRRLAAQKMKHESPGQTLDPTALVHEAYIRLVDGENAQNWQSRGHFFSAAAEAMRRILIDNARRKRRGKHGGDRLRLRLDEAISIAENDSEELLALNEALDKLAAKEPEKAQLVKLRYFAGLSLGEIASLLGISESTVKRQWNFARTWLYLAMHKNDQDGSAAEK